MGQKIVFLFMDLIPNTRSLPHKRCKAVSFYPIWTCITNFCEMLGGQYPSSVLPHCKGDLIWLSSHLVLIPMAQESIGKKTDCLCKDWLPNAISLLVEMWNISLFCLALQSFKFQIVYYKSLSYTRYFLNWKWYKQTRNYFSQEKIIQLNLTLLNYLKYYKL